MSSNIAYVVFCEDSGHWWSRWLHPFIQHCYVLVPDYDRFIKIERKVQGLDTYTVSRGELHLPSMIVRKVEIRQAGQQLLMLNTCTGHVKQMLGITNPFILTPYQLYRYLEKNQ